MAALNNCLLYAFLCLAIFCEIDSKGQIPNDGVINIDEQLKGEVIEGSGRGGDEDDVDQEESSGGLEDDEDTPLLSSMTPGVRPTVQRGRSSGGETDSTSFEFGSGGGDGRQGNDGRDEDAATTTTTTAGPSLIYDDYLLKRRYFATSPPPPPPTLPPTSPSSTLAPTTRREDPATTTTVPTTTTTATSTTTAARPSYEEQVDDEDVSVSEGSGFYGSDDNNKDKIPPWSPPSSTMRPTTTTTTTTTTSDYRFVGSNEFPWGGRGGGEEVEEKVELKEETNVFGSPSLNNDDEEGEGGEENGEDVFGGRGSGHSPVFGRKPEGEVSKPPTTNFKPRKPDPTKFVTHYDPNKDDGKSDFEDDKNTIHHSGGTGYDQKDLDDDYMGNNIPSIGKAVMGPKKQENADSSLWHQPGILAVCIIGAAVVGLLCAVLLVMFIVYRMRKKDEGSYDLDETTKRSPRINGYQRTNQNEFYA